MQRRRADRRVAVDAHAGSGGGEAGSSEGDTVDLGTAVTAVAGQAQRAAMLRVLACAHDGDRHGIALGVLDRLFVNHDAHARPTVANSPFPARLCRE